MNKRIVFRADGNGRIGAGHIMRCLSVATAASKMGSDSLFITADESYSEVIQKAGIKNVILGTEYSDMEGESRAISDVLRQFKPSICLIDSYFVTDTYFYDIGKLSGIAYIDDFFNRVYPVDILINYSAGANTLGYEKAYKSMNKPPAFLLGERYAPLREEFQGLEEVPVNTVVSDVLFSVGGSDPDRVVSKFLKSLLNSSELMKKRFHLVIGKYEPDLDEIMSICNDHANLIPHQNITEMSKLIRTCDVAVSASGTTVFELAACGIPTITYILEDNQIMGAQSLEKKGITINAGDLRDEDYSFEPVFAHLQALCANYKRRRDLHDKAIKAIDGNGAIRLAAKLLGKRLIT